MQHKYPFDPTYGFALEALQTVGYPPEPADFAPFWRDSFDENSHVPLNIARRPIQSPSPQFDLFEIEYDSLDHVRIGGWMAVPRDQAFARGIVVGHGYGGREAPDLNWLPGTPAVAIFPCARGFNRSKHPQIPGHSGEHVLYGIQTRETYVHRGCAADLWSAASALIELYPQAANRLDYIGGSFGGGIGALMLPWDQRFRRAFLDVPSFGNHPLRLQLPCYGSGEPVRRYYRHHPEVVQVLAYFDSATAARHISIPVLVAAAKFDPCVPPPGQFAVYNALRGPKKLFLRQASHCEYPQAAEEDAELLAQLQEWFA